MANSLNSKNIHVKRKHTQISEKIRHLLSDARKLPHSRKTVPTGGGPPLTPLPAWQQIFVDIVRESPATEGLSCGVESEVRPQPEEDGMESEPHVDVMERCFENISSDDECNVDDAPVQLTAVQMTAVTPKDIPTPRRNKPTTGTGKKSLQDEQRELITSEKEKVSLEKRLLKWKIKLAKLNYKKMTDCERLPSTDSENEDQ